MVSGSWPKRIDREGERSQPRGDDQGEENLAVF